MRPAAIVRHKLQYMALCCLLLLPVYAHTAEPVTDLRVLIDISGSMNQNDPQNLRRPALKLLVGLMPEGTRSGVWSFGQYVNMQVKHGVVDKQWKASANLEAEQIHSRGLYTNIEEALKRSTYDWTRPDDRYARHLILLTDGVVDISKDPVVNQQSRQRILDKYLPDLKNAGVRLHTIALSANADHALLQRMAILTDGWYQQIDNADTLQRVFLKLFEKAANTDSLPLDENKFVVDASVEDMTLLVFRDVKASVTRVLAPDGKVYTPSSKGEAIEWLSEQGFDLITFRSPQPGNWKIDAAIDPDNRVLVVTNLKLTMPSMPNNILAGESVVLQAALQEAGKTITRADFLRLVEFKVGQHVPDGTHTFTVLEDNGFSPDSQAGDGVYSRYADNLSLAGTHELSIVVDGKTFQRRKSHTIQVLGSAVRVTQQETAEGIKLTATPVTEIVQLNSVRGDYQLDGTGNGELQIDGASLTQVFPAEHAQKTLQLQLRGTLINGKPFVSREELRLIGTPPMVTRPEVNEASAAPVVTDSSVNTTPAEPVAVTPPEVTPDEKPVEVNQAIGQPPAGAEAEAETEAEAEAGVNWLLLVIWLVGGNSIALGIGYFVYRKWALGRDAINSTIEELVREKHDDDSAEIVFDEPEEDEAPAATVALSAEDLQQEQQYREEIQGQATADDDELQSVADLQLDDEGPDSTKAAPAETNNNEKIQSLMDNNIDDDSGVDDTEREIASALSDISDVESDENDTSASNKDKNKLESDEELLQTQAADPDTETSAEAGAVSDVTEDEIQALIDEAGDVFGGDENSEKRKTEA